MSSLRLLILLFIAVAQLKPPAAAPTACDYARGFAQGGDTCTDAPRVGRLKDIQPKLDARDEPESWSTSSLHDVNAIFEP